MEVIDVRVPYFVLMIIVTFVLFSFFKDIVSIYVDAYISKYIMYT